jgi:hypothetical protein
VRLQLPSLEPRNRRRNPDILPGHKAL